MARLSIKRTEKAEIPKQAGWNMADDPDRRLVRKSKLGDKNAFGKLVKQYQKKILLLAFDLSGNYEDAKDIAQESFIKAFEALQQFQERALFSTWLYRITVNLANQYHRRRKQHKYQDINWDFGENEGALLQDENEKYEALSNLEKMELKNEIDCALARLSKNQRAACVLKFYHQKSGAEIAQILGCSEGTARIHIFRALNHLRHFLKDAIRK